MNVLTKVLAINYCVPINACTNGNYVTIMKITLQLDIKDSYCVKVLKMAVCIIPL